MSKRCKNLPERHLPFYTTNGQLSDDMLIEWYKCCQPVGSGPINMCRMLCACIEDLAAERGIELPPARGTKLPPLPLMEP